MRPIRLNVPWGPAAAGAGWFLLPGRAWADAGLPHFAAPDWSTLSTAQSVGAGVALTLGLACGGLWAARNPAAAARFAAAVMTVPVVAVGLLLTAASASGSSAVGVVIGLAVAAAGGFAGYAVLRTARRRAFLGPDLGLLLTALTLLTLAATVVLVNLGWIDPRPNRPPGL